MLNASTLVIRSKKVNHFGQFKTSHWSWEIIPVTAISDKISRTGPYCWSMCYTSRASNALASSRPWQHFCVICPICASLHGEMLLPCVWTRDISRSLRFYNLLLWLGFLSFKQQVRSNKKGMLLLRSMFLRNLGDMNVHKAYSLTLRIIFSNTLCKFYAGVPTQIPQRL